MNPKSFEQFQVAKSHKELGDPEVNKSKEEWQQILSKQQYEVTRNHGTERAFTGEYEKNKQKGIYKCIGCGAPLFSSETKFDSGSGWPSFYQSANKDAIAYVEDRSWGYRVEVLCKKCHSHLGHVFDDAYDQPTKLRYCINSASLKFEKQ